MQKKWMIFWSYLPWKLPPVKGHIVALGITEEVEMGKSPENTIEQIRSQGGIAIVPHPFVRYREGLCDYVKIWIWMPLKL